MSNFKRLSVEQNLMLVNLLSKHGSVLTDWEYSFISTIVKFKQMSSKQKEIVSKIVLSFSDN